MIPAIIGENKPEAFTFAIGAGAGAYAGSQIYKTTPDKMTVTILKDDKKVKLVTDKFIDYARKVAEKDVFSAIDPHTERNWINEKLGIIRRATSRAKINPKGPEREQFQKIYDTGVLFLTARDEVHPEDIGLARRGANAITYGNKVAKRNIMLVCALAVGTFLLAGKKFLENFKENKQ